MKGFSSCFVTGTAAVPQTTVIEGTPMLIGYARVSKGDEQSSKVCAASVLSSRKSGAGMARLYDVSEPTVSRIVAEYRQNLETDNASQP